jgi:hypothetical protein
MHALAAAGRLDLSNYQIITIFLIDDAKYLHKTLHFQLKL